MNINRKSFNYLSVLAHFAFCIYCMLCIFPIILIISISFSSSKSVQDLGYRLIPQSFDIVSYKFLFMNPGIILKGYTVTLMTSIVGTALTVFVCSSIGYVLSRKDFKPGKYISFYVFFTMLFSGGLVPFYILVKKLHLINSFAALWLPGIAPAFYILLLRTFFQQHPYELVEAAKIDGASEFRIFFRIAFPLAKPAIATVALLRVYGYWNDYFSSMIFINNDSYLSISYILYRMVSTVQFLIYSATNMPNGVDLSTLPTEGIRMAMLVLVIAPVLFIFPYFQKYFVKGMSIGSTKG